MFKKIFKNIIYVLIITCLFVSFSYKEVHAAVNFKTKTGYFYVQIQGDGKTTKRKIQISLASTDRTKTQTATISDVSSGSDYPNNHNFSLKTTSAKTKSADGVYSILILTISYTKPAHYRAIPDYKNKVDGYRFNFNSESTGTTTVNLGGHRASNYTEGSVTIQVNVANAGIGNTDDAFTPTHATGYIKLSKHFSQLQIDPNRWNS